MALADWTDLNDSLGSSVVAKGVTAGIARPNGGGNFVYGFNSQQVTAGAVGLHNNQVNFAPMASGGSVRGAVKRGVSGGNTGFSPFLYIGLQGQSVNDGAYMLGLSDSDPHRIVLKKGTLTSGLQDEAPNAPTNGILLRSDTSFQNDTWLHLRLDMTVQGSGDVLLQVYQNDLTANTVASPVWTTPTGMEGPQSPTIVGFVDDALSVNTGSAPYTSGRAGFGMQSADVTRRSYMDHIEIARQV
jgi:hypothetical protein